MKINDSIFVASAYLFGLPALYIVLTDYRKKDYVGFHGGQALALWCLFFLIFFGQRSLVDWLWSKSFLPGLQWLEPITVLVLGGYALFCAYRGFVGVIFRIPR